MRNEWTLDDLKKAAGTIVAQKLASDKWHMPMMIGYISLPEGQYMGMTDLTDGCFIRYKSEEDLLKTLNAAGYVIVNKIVTQHHRVSDTVENRHVLPTVTITSIAGYGK